MVDRRCKICRTVFNFVGGSVFCSEACQKQWPILRTQVYEILVRPARNTDYGPGENTPKNRAIKAIELDRVLTLYQSFLASSDPYGFISEHPEINEKMRGD